MNDMTKTIALAKVVSCPAEAAWALVRSGRDIDRLLPDLVRSCRLEGEGVGARRHCGTEKGTIEETIVLVDDAARTFGYRIDRQELMPLRGYRGMVHVADVGEGRTEILWLATYELLDAGADSGVRAALTGLLGQGIDAIGAIAGRRA